MLYSSAARWKVVMCDPVCQHCFRSCHTIYFIFSIDDICYWTIPSFVEPFTLRHLSVAGTLLLPSNICATTTRYRKVRRTHITLCHAILSGNFAIQAPIIIVKLAFSLRRHFFQRELYASAISYPENMENSAQVIRRTLAIIQ